MRDFLRWGQCDVYIPPSHNGRVTKLRCVPAMYTDTACPFYFRKYAAICQSGWWAGWTTDEYKFCAVKDRRCLFPPQPLGRLRVPPSYRRQFVPGVVSRATVRIFEFMVTIALETGRSRVRFPMVSLEFFIDIILPVALWPWGRHSL
jgi:hypothetical protein